MLGIIYIKLIIINFFIVVSMNEAKTKLHIHFFLSKQFWRLQYAVSAVKHNNLIHKTPNNFIVVFTSQHF